MRVPDKTGRVALITVHTSPLAQLGGRDAGGMNVYIRELAKRLLALGRPVDVFTRRTSPDSPEIESFSNGARLIHIAAGPATDLPKDRLYDLLPDFQRGMQAFAAREGLHYDVIHSHYWLSGWVGRRLQRAWQVPHVVMFHTLGEIKNRARFTEREPELRIANERQIARTADRVVCASRDELAQLARHYGVDPAKATVIPCGVDIGRFHPGDGVSARKALGLEGKRVILFAGRLEPLKGVDILLRACGQLADDLDFALVIVGGDQHASKRRQALEREAARLGIADRVRFDGSVPQDRLVDYYRAADVCVVPSFYESFGLVALEAMACGTPVVASRVGGLTATVRDGETGYLVNWHCPEPFAERVETLLRNEDLRSRMGARAAEVATGFRWEVVAARIDALYNELAVERAGTIHRADVGPHRHHVHHGKGRRHAWAHG